MRQIINASQIAQWFAPTRRDAQELLPHLVRKLITATVAIDHLQAVRIPVGDQIGKPGFDGTVEVTTKYTYIPKGESVWEMGVNRNAQSKANDDYKKRMEKTNESIRKRTSFMFVTPRVWSDKKNSGANWAQEKRDANEWLNVRALDATDLEAWLDCCPAVARWLARQMGIPVQGIFDVEGYIGEEFIARYGVEWSPDLILGGRVESAKSIVEWLPSEDRRLKVRGESVEEAALFVAACISQLEGDVTETTANRCVFADGKEALELLTGLGTQHIVVALNHDVRRRADTINSPSIRLITVGSRFSGNKSDSSQVELERIKRKACEEALVAMGVEESRAGQVARGSKGSLTALLWLIATEDDEPLLWSGAKPGTELVPLLLAGQWESESKIDRDAVSNLAGRNYDELKNGPLVRWREPDGPLIDRAGVWDWMAWDFAWSLLGRYIDADQVKRFEDVVMAVLEESDPRYELDADKRWAASLYGKVRKHSDALIRGLTGSIAQFAINADAGKCPQWHGVANRLVRQLLMPKKDRGLRWLSLAKWLPDLAEAAPDEFLEASEALVADTEATKRVFEEEPRVCFSSSMHTYVLWALERLAWSPDYLSRVTLLLGRLAALDPGGQLANRPKKSLFEIYVPWHPHTTTNSTRRMAAIKALYDRCPTEAWCLGVSLLPKMHVSVMATAAPKWRQWKPEENITVTISEYWQFVENLVVALLEWVKDDETRWAELVVQFPEIQRGYPELGNMLLSGLEAVDASSIKTDARCALAKKIREIVTRHKQFPDTKWVLDANSLDRLDALYDKFTPDDPVQKKGWLFNSWPELPDQYVDTPEDHDARVLSMRKLLIEEVYKAEGLAGVKRLAGAVEEINEVGSIFALVEADDDRMFELLVEGMSSVPTKQHFRLACGVVWQRVEDQGVDWLKKNGPRLHKRIGDQGLANLALPAPAEGPLWDLVDDWGKDVARIYWERANVRNLPEVDRDLNRAIQHLVQAGRPYRAIDVLGMSIFRKKRKDGEDLFVLPVDPKIVISLLQEAPKTKPDDEGYPASGSSVGRAVSELMQWLERSDTDEDTLVQLEWVWMSVLEHEKRGLVVLQRCLSTNPKWFVELLKLIFCAEGEEPVSLPDTQQAMRDQAYKLLHNWKVVPGTKYVNSNGGEETKVAVMQEALKRWVEEARRLAEDCGRLGVCDERIGEVLAHAPHDNDGTWPCEGVRNVIEEVRSTELDSGIHIAEINKRGAHFRKPGGDQEREIAAKYKGYRDRVIDRWPRTGAILNGIKKDYEGQAKRYDEQDGFDEFAD